MGKGITIVGLGPGSEGHLSLETMTILKSSDNVILRTAVHPSVSKLQEEGIDFISCDSFYETGDSFDEVYRKIVTFVLAKGEEQEVVYAVPGSPLVAERTVTMLREQTRDAGLPLKILPSMSFLDLAYVDLGIDPIAGLRIIDALDFEALADTGQYPLIVTQVYSKLVASEVKINLMDVLDDEAPLYFLRNLGLPDEECRLIKLYELDRQPQIDHLTSIFIPCQDRVDMEEIEDLPEERNFSAAAGEVFYDDEIDIMPLVDVMQTLREPEGCPWDIEQTHESIRRNMVEEVYELLEAIDANDLKGMQEELGDVLMQVVFHAQIAAEAKKFDLQDVINEVTEKLIHRHPHVFGTVEVSDSDEVIKNWDAIKLEEKKDRKHVLDGVSIGLPALMRAYKLHSKAAKVGFDWPDNNGVWDKVKEEMQELSEAVATGSLAEQEHELGDLLFILAGYAKHIGLEPEVALNAANNRFIKRFGYVEAKVMDSGKAWQEFSLADLDNYWAEAKKLEKNN